MNLKNLILILLIIISLMSCSHTYIPLIEYHPPHKIIRDVHKNYRINDTLEVIPGNIMLEFKLSEIHSILVYKAPEDIDIYNEYSNYLVNIIKKDEIYYPMFKSDFGIVVLKKLSENMYDDHAFEIDSNGYVLGGYGEFDPYSYEVDGLIYNGFITNSFHFKKNINYNKNKIFDTTYLIEKLNSNHTHKFYYTGKSDNNIKIAYKDFVEHEENQDVYDYEFEFNLNESEFRIKSLRIKIISATNSYLKFVVLSDDDLPWVD